MRFWLRLHAPGGGEAAADGLSDEIAEAVLEEAARFAEEQLEPLYRVGDRCGASLVDGRVVLPEAFGAAYAKFAEAGWVGLPADPDYGGQGLPQRLSVAVNEIWKAANLAFSLCPMLTQGAIDAVRRHGDAALRRRLLPRMISGEWTGTMNLTEPQAGSDLGAVRTSAVPDGDHYRLKGRKVFITWGDHDLAENIVHLVLARTPDAPPGVRGLSMFAVPKRLIGEDGALGADNEVATLSLEEKLGLHASPTCALSYGDGEGAVAYRIGEVHRGLEYMFTMMNAARIAVGVEGLALSERAYQQALAYALERVQGSAPGGRGLTVIAEHPDVRRMLMLMKAGTEAMRGLCYAAAAESDRAAGGGEGADAALARVSLLTPIVKGWCTELAQELVSLGMQVHGGVGYIEETGAAQVLRDARITTIYEGTTGIQANDLVGRKLLRDDGRALGALLDEIRGMLPALAAAGGALAGTRAALEDGVEAARSAACTVVERHAADPRLAGAVAVNLLMLLGTLLGGSRLAAAALAARAALDRGASGKPALEARLATSEFYAQHYMPRIGAYRAAVLAGSRTIMALTAEQLAR